MTRPARPSSSRRGYDAAHRADRRHWQRRIDAGELVRCRRGPACKYAETVAGELVGGIIGPDTGWDLGHDDRDRTLPRAPEHLDCNRATTGRGGPRKRPQEPHPGII